MNSTMFSFLVTTATLGVMYVDAANRSQVGDLLESQGESRESILSCRKVGKAIINDGKPAIHQDA